MPLTPFHFGPGLLLKPFFRRNFSLTIFIITQIIIDAEVVWNVFHGKEKIHTFLHTYIGSTLLVGIMTIIFFIGKRLHRRLDSDWSRSFHSELDYQGVLISAAIGAWSHVLLDSLMHYDITPWYPLSETNSLLYKVSVLSIHVGCVVSGIIGAVLCFRQWKR